MMADAGIVEVQNSRGSSGRSERNYSELEIQALSQQVAAINVNFDEEAPIAAVEGSGSNKSPPSEPVSGKAPLSLMSYEEGEEYEEVSSSPKPLIILPVQSEGVPTSGAFPLGRPHPTSPAALPLGDDQLKQVLLQQLEYYFSKDNLSSDKYLLSQMDGDNYVPISVIGNFNQVKKLTTDMALILEVLGESAVLQLDETNEKVRAIPEKRCVLILREIPKDTPKKEIESLFSGEKCPRCVTCEFADNNCWYVTFDSEQSTQKAFAFLREEVRMFLGQPIRARIKGTTVQRSSGMPKTKHTGPFNVPPVYNGPGAPPQLPYYPPPPQSGVVPWSPTPPTSTSTSPYFENFSHFNNGFSGGPQQGPPSQVGTTGQSPAPATGTTGGAVQPGLVQGARYPSTGFPYMPGGRGRMGGPSNRPLRGGMTGGERGQSPPVFPADGESSQTNADKADYKSARGIREHGGTVGPNGGVAGAGLAGNGPPGGRFNRHIPPDGKTSRVKNVRYRGNGGEGERGAPIDKPQLPPRQQNKVQPKLDLATAHFPPLPNSSSSENGPLPNSAPPLTSHSHTSTEDGPKTLSDIVRGGSRPPTKETSSGIVGPAPSPAAVASNIVEKTIASASAKVSQTPAVPNSVASQSPPDSSSQTVASSDPSPRSGQAKGDVSSGYDVSSGGGGVTMVTTSRPVMTASSVVSSGGGFAHHASGGGPNRAPPPPPAPALGSRSSQKAADPKVSGKFYNNGNNGNNKAYTRYSDRELPLSKQNRNTQVVKSDIRSAPAANNRSRHKERDMSLSSSRNSSGGSGGGVRPGNGSRLNNTKSPKAFKKSFPPHHTPQASPPPPGPSTDSPPLDGSQATGTKTENISSSSSQSQSAVSAKPEKLSYAQMAQKKNNQNSKQDSAEEGGKTVSSPTSPQTAAEPGPPPQSTKSIKSTSTGSLTVGQGQSSGTITSKSAPTSPTKESGAATSGCGQSKESEV